MAAKGVWHSGERSMFHEVGAFGLTQGMKEHLTLPSMSCHYVLPRTAGEGMRDHSIAVMIDDLESP